MSTDAYAKVTGKVDYSNAPDPKSLIQKERDSAQFDVDQMNYFLEGSKERALEVRKFIHQMETDPILAASSHDYDATKAEHRENTLKKINRLTRYIEVETFDSFERRMSIISLMDPQFHTRIGVHFGLFVGCVRGTGTADQLGYWILKKESAYVKNIYGCFGMTELAHGSNVAGLETTATFDEENDEFIINTPHLGATKWWIGGAAHSATHCSVYARLIIKGKDYGVKTFVVPLRDSEHNLMPGVAIGDIGAKMGRDGIDNGWIQFSHVRIPRYFMLQKYTKVSEEGEVTEPPLNQLSYGALLTGRVAMVKDAFRWSSRFVTIALRYAVGRKQFKAALAKESDGESQLLDYPLHQRRLIPLLAMAYAFSNGANVLQEQADSSNDQLDEAVQNEDKALLDAGVEAMKSLFIASGSLKSTATWLTLSTIDQCRQACGGHGYSSYSGFGKGFNDFAVQCTWEGDNNILGMSVGKQLVKKYSGITKDGEKASGILEFLGNYKKYLGKEPVLQAEDLKNPRTILKAIEVTLIRASARANDIVDQKGGDTDFIGADLVVLSKLLAHFFLYKSFLDKIDSIKDQPELYKVLDVLAQLYGASIVLEGFSGTFLTYSVATTEAIAHNSTDHIAELCSRVRPHVIPLTDSFMMSDMLINSAIGNYDGDIYKNYFKIVNTNNPPQITKPPYAPALQGMLNRSSLEERQRFEYDDEALDILSGNA
ncbi:hypothetical protein C7M61_004757 [Candidozyma pseudohaemuli]|uniref:Acyl-coenzyme A oxidase n=1 Tax=Candidozyma pseudohaemuli TaxID=418784 RepID=A0A2P7YH66_9ASCO|nr:hypothetical protein C7M61_004757 [[Candida] pseudohaemulonii]PSK35299.1 hypothetical protein C7M61_004757 [[Candida] pseudohaemulonii]